MKSMILALSSALLVIGQIFSPVVAASIPAAAAAARADAAPAPALAAAPAVTAASCGSTVTVQRGDYLTKIARICGITYSALLAANPEITDPNRVYPGQIIRIKAGTPIPVTGGTYTVVKGDTLFKISVRFGTTVATLMKINPSITNAALIYAGQVIQLPAYSGGPRVVLSTRSARANGTLTVNVSGFPANANIDYRVGKQGAAPGLIVDGKTSAAGDASATITLPATAKVGELWVVRVMTTDLTKGTEITSATITVIQ